MSPINPQEPTSPKYWRSEEQLTQSSEFETMKHREFPENASVLEDNISRRTFVKFVGATAALAGLAGCSTSFRKPEKNIIPYVKTPEDLVPGKSVFYASALQVGSEVVGVLVESSEGRPTKIEGNPLHPASLGAASAQHQAFVLDLYDPDRLKSSLLKGEGVSKSQAQTWLADINKQLISSKGQGYGLLFEQQVSPTFYRLVKQLQSQFPQLKFYRYSPLSNENEEKGVFSVTGQWVNQVYDFEKANTVVSFDSDFLSVSPLSLAYARQFASRRDPDHETGMNRLYVFESQFSITGGKADHRVKVKPSELESVVWTLAQALVKKGALSSSALLNLNPSRFVSSDPSVDSYCEAIAEELIVQRGKSVILAGQQATEMTHALVFLINNALSNVGSTVKVRKKPFSDVSFNTLGHAQSLSALRQDIDRKVVTNLVVLGGNPAYDAPADLDFVATLKNLGQLVHLSSFKNETSALSTQLIPMTHALEDWNDLEAYEGTVSIVQPLISPMYESFSILEVLSGLSGNFRSAYDEVRETWKNTSDSQWKKWLHEGVVLTQSGYLSSVPLKESGVTKLLHSTEAHKAIQSGFEVQFIPSHSVYDGRFANNGWLQELPDPISKLTWDNALLISPKTAGQMKLKKEDMVKVHTSSGQTLDVAVWMVPGVAHNVGILSLGYGRKEVGRVGVGTGFNAYAIRTQNASSYVQVTLKKLSKSYPLASTQDHGAMEGRALYRASTLDAFQKHPEFAKEAVEHPPLVSSWPEKKYDTGNQWGMAIDLSKCTGCSACITACQSENNIPIVGKKQVRNYREMQWIRVDRYFEGDSEDPEMVYQPVTCLQCEMAPCEQVCPVAATAHSQEGLNDMTYNRCVGTRYCANNCPVKVRRFNFLDFHQRNPQSVAKQREHFFDYFREPDKSVQMQFNPNVTVRMRGVMEKCTYCVQRINEARITAKNEEREIEDGEVVVACQQTCPTNAVMFGNILDPNSKIAKWKKNVRDYHMLAELNLKPRTSYLAGIKNPNPKLEKKVA